MAKKTTRARKRRMLIATGNPGKYGEIMEVLGGLPYRFLRPVDLGLSGDPEENGETYEENAFLKADHYYRKCRFITLAEDSGIAVDALAGGLGVKTRRWGAGGKASDEEWIRYFLDAMKDVPKEKRTARFICVAAVMGARGDGKNSVRFFRGETEGVITDGLEAPIKAGIPLSSCFRPEGFGKVYAALSAKEKNSVSHRGKAMKAVRDFLAG